MTEIQAADPRARKTVLRLVVAAVIIGVIILTLTSLFQPQLESWLMDDNMALQTRLNWVLLVLVVALMPLLFGVIYFWRMGSAVMKARRFPPPGLAVIKDTWIVEGEDARIRGMLIKVLAGLLGAGILAVPVMLWLLSRLITQA